MENKIKGMNNHLNIQARELFFLFLLPIALYTGFATDFTYNFFKPYWLWQAYNEFYIALANGRLDVPVEAIGLEGQYLNGKALMYYGMLPALARGLLAPFVDLSVTPVSALIVFLFTILGNVTLQYQILAFIKRNSFSNTHLYLTSAVLWLTSASFFIVQNASIYHEPYAASLCLFNIYLAILIKNNFEFNKQQSLLSLAIVSGLAIHTRMPMALALYATTCLLMLVTVSSTIKRESSFKEYFLLIRNIIVKHWLSLLVMFLFGLSILWLNYLRFGDIFSFMGKNGHYGYFLAGEGYSLRTCNMVPKTDFSPITRIIPNFIVYSIGGWNLHDQLMVLFKTGYGRKELPLIPALLMWLPGYFALLWLIKSPFSGKTKLPVSILLITLTMSLGAIFQLTYPTVTHRYTAELWPLFALPLAITFIYFNKLSKSYQRLIFASALLSIGYCLFTVLTNPYHLGTKRTLDAKYRYSDEELAPLQNLTNDIILKRREAHQLGKEKGCSELSESKK